MKRIFLFITVFICVISKQNIFAQQQKTTILQHVTIGAEYNYLYSTHGTKFQGPGIIATTALNPRWDIGLGFSWVHCPYHPDNDYDLSHLNLAPIYAVAQYNFAPTHKLEPYAIVKLGLSFMHYQQRWGEYRIRDYMKANNINNVEQLPYEALHDKSVHSTGLYTFGGLGLKWHITKLFSSYINAGLIGYKMSFNDLDINPHGFNANIGISYTF